jgi:hypothetical protein
MEPIRKFVRTPHLEGSNLQPGDSADGQMKILDLLNAYPEARWVWEEKVDGANAGISFNADLEMRIQSRGHYLTGGAREAQFNMLKDIACVREADFLDVLEDRFILYGEWCAAKHSQFYDRLPHLFIGFDIWDKRDEMFISTARRNEILDALGLPCSPVVHDDYLSPNQKIIDLVGRSAYRSENWMEGLLAAAHSAGVSEEQVLRETDTEGPTEGVYLRLEDETSLLARFKFVRPGFRQAIEESGSHWSARTIIRNQLAPGVDLYAAPERSEFFDLNA